MVIKTGCISKRTFFKGIALAVIIGIPYSFLCEKQLWTTMLAMFAAPFIVDGLRPIVYLEN